MKDDTKISKNRQKKEQLVAEISEKVGRAKAMVFTNYKGMTHQQIEALKKSLKPLEAEMAVTKNTLLKLALQKVSKETKVPKVSKGYPFDTSDIFNLEGPTATLFAYADPIAPLKELAKVMKLFKFPTIKFAIFEGKTLDEAEVTRLSTLPTREVLLAQMIGNIKAPLYGLHRALSWNLQKLVMTLKAIESKKQ